MKLTRTKLSMGILLYLAGCGSGKTGPEQTVTTSTTDGTQTSSTTITTGTTSTTGTLVDTGHGHPVVATDCDPNRADLSAAESDLIALPAESWWQAPDSEIRPLCPTDRNGCANLLEAWNGGAFDPNHNRMLVFGGGHADYSGNEVYGFDVGSLSWSRLTDPSPESYESQDPLPDGQPVSRHTYDTLVYLEEADVMLAMGGSRWRDGYGTSVTWAFDGNDTWTNLAPTDGPNQGGCCSQGSAYDANSGRAFYHLGDSISTYDPVTNRWEAVLDLGFPPLWPRYVGSGDKTGAFDTNRGLVWFMGSRLYMVINAATGEVVTDNWITTGAGTFDNTTDVDGRTDQVISTGGAEIIEKNAPGVAYDKAADSLVTWSGGGPWVLDLASKTWTRGASAGAPAAQSELGTYGRWRYIERTNVFILVNSVDDDVYFYKHTAGCGA